MTMIVHPRFNVGDRVKLADSIRATFDGNPAPDDWIGVVQKVNYSLGYPYFVEFNNGGIACSYFMAGVELELL